MSVDSKYDVLHKMINASIFGWPDGEVEKAHALLEEIRKELNDAKTALTKQLEFEEFRGKMLEELQEKKL